MKLKKAKIFKIALIAISVLIVGYALRSAVIYFSYIVPDKDYFQNQYVQVIYPTGIFDYISAKEVIEEADTAFSTITYRETAKDKFGELGKYCVTDDAASEEHSIKLISANLGKDKGYIWVTYYQTAYDANETVTFGSGSDEFIGGRILTRWEVEKINDEWVVVSIKEHP